MPESFNYFLSAKLLSDEELAHLSDNHKQSDKGRQLEIIFQKSLNNTTFGTSYMCDNMTGAGP